MKRMLGSVLATLAVAAAGPCVVSAQSAAEVRAAIDQVFEGMRRADPQMVREVLAPDARFAVRDARDGPATIRAQPVDGWLRAMADSDSSWDEQIYDVQIQVDDDMASAWIPYTFYLAEEISHCGVNSIELLRDATGWRVTQISDTRRSESCPDPLGSD